MNGNQPGGLYIHAAFCRMKCIYCDFYSVGDRIADWRGYVDALIAELNHRISELPKPLQTIYIGGGTPSLMPREDFLSLCEALKPYMDNVVEFTIEVNPDDVAPEMLRVWKQGGANRLSMGIQCFDDELLKTIRRRHSAETARNAYKMAREVFDNVSIDLIYGLPGQTIEMWRKDVEEVIRMRPEHISSYSLMYEEGTALTLLRDKGMVSETPEDTSEEMMKILITELRNAGYEHYEISNFALPGFRSRHNSSYWHAAPYLGLGPSAHSYDGLRTRSANKADVRAYLKRWQLCKDNGEVTDNANIQDDVSTREFLSEEELFEEYVMIRLRTMEGIDLEEFRRSFGESTLKRLIKNGEKYLADGSLVLSASHLFIAEDAMLISDAIILSLVA